MFNCIKVNGAACQRIEIVVDQCHKLVCHSETPMSSKALNFTEPQCLHLYNGYNNDNDITDLTWVLGRSTEILCVIVF